MSSACTAPSKRSDAAEAASAVAGSSSLSQWVLKQTEPIEKFYKLGKQLGQPGQFGHARLAVHSLTGQQFAVKVISKARFTRASDIKYHYEQLRSEITVMSKMNHANIVKLYEVYETLDTLYLVMECCLGGELFDRIKLKGSYSEKDAAFVLRQMCEGIAYMHEYGIAHCDLKPDNFLFAHSAEDALVKIIDFGMSKFVQRRKYFQVICGTPYYCAPEVIQGRYSEHCDMWSLGVVMFVMLFGFPPFYSDESKFGAETDQRIFQLIQRGFQPVTKSGYGPFFPVSIPASAAAKDLIGKLLTTDPAKRLTATEALEHEWLTGKLASDKPILDNVLKNLKSFQATQKLKQVVLNMMSNTLSTEEIQTLKQTFQEIDENKDGIITLAELQHALQRVDNSQQNALKTEEINALFQMADLDNSGTLSYEELLLTCVHKKISAKEERIYQAFCALDLNGDGKLSAEEIKKVLTGNDLNSAKQLIAEIDVDGDGQIDYGEFLSMWANQQTTKTTATQSLLNQNNQLMQKLQK